MCKITEPINPTPSPSISKPTKHPLLYPTPLRSSKHVFPNTKFFSTSLLSRRCFYHQPSASQPWAATSPRSPLSVTALTDAQAKPSPACWSSSGLHCLSPLAHGLNWHFQTALEIAPDSCEVFWILGCNGFSILPIGIDMNQMYGQMRR